MKKIIVYCLLLTACPDFHIGAYCLLLSPAASAENKVVRKSVRKLISPPVAPAPAPYQIPTEEAELVIVPTSDSTLEIDEQSGYFGWGINCDINASLSSVLMGRVNLAFTDPLLLGGKIGLAEDAIEYKAGLGWALGRDINNQSVNMIPLFADAVVYLREGSLFGYDPHIGLGLNQNLWGDGGTFGGTGFQLYCGVKLDYGWEYGKTGIILGYQQLKVSNIRSVEGLYIAVNQPFTL